MKKEFIIFLMLMVLVLPLQAGEQPADPAATNSGGLSDVVVKGGQRSGVRSEKPPLKMDLDIDEPVFSLMTVEKDLLQRQPESMRNPSAGFAPFLNNENTILPGRIRISRNPVKTFYILRGILANFPAQFQEIGTGWEMTITDSDGRSFRKFSGKGLPPSNLDWDGRGDNGQIAAVGKTYSSVTTYRDTRAQSRTFVGEPFQFDGILHQEQNGLILTLSMSAIYQLTKKDGVEVEDISDSGKELLKEASDWVKRFYFNYPLSLSLYSNNSASEKAKQIADWIKKYLLLPHQEITQAVASVDVQGERVDLIIRNR